MDIKDTLRLVDYWSRRVRASSSGVPEKQWQGNQHPVWLCHCAFREYTLVLSFGRKPGGAVWESLLGFDFARPIMADRFIGRWGTDFVHHSWMGLDRLQARINEGRLFDEAAKHTLRDALADLEAQPAWWLGQIHALSGYAESDLISMRFVVGGGRIESRR